MTTICLKSEGDGELMAMLRRWKLISERWARLPEGTAARARAEKEMENAFDRIMATRATTARAMLGKLDMYGDQSFNEPEMASVYDDLRGLVGLPPSASVGEG